MGEESASSFKGQFIIAMPNLLDPNFDRTVSCICEFAPEATLGLIVNRVHPLISCRQILQEFKIKYVAEAVSIPVHVGGPVTPGELFVLHGPPFHWEGCHMVTSSLALSKGRDILEAIGLGEGPESLLITLGYAGWNPGQLEREIMENAWLTCDIDEEIIFETPMESRWETAIRRMGIDPASLSDMAGHA